MGYIISFQHTPLAFVNGAEHVQNKKPISKRSDKLSNSVPIRSNGTYPLAIGETGVQNRKRYETTDFADYTDDDGF